MLLCNTSRTAPLPHQTCRPRMTVEMESRVDVVVMDRWHNWPLILLALNGDFTTFLLWFIWNHSIFQLPASYTVTSESGQLLLFWNTLQQCGQCTKPSLTVAVPSYKENVPPLSILYKIVNYHSICQLPANDTCMVGNVRKLPVTSGTLYNNAHNVKVCLSCLVMHHFYMSAQPTLQSWRNTSKDG